jgi:16S rRNA (guanine966-N2)-methyltransferase
VGADVRIVGGDLRGRPISAPAGQATRPTADRVRQTIFDVLAHAYGDPVRGARVLDLFAGTGAFGLEALSRGAAFALFVEDDIAARGVIRMNAERLGVIGRTRIFRRDATALGPIGNLAPFGLVFADPPYRQGLGERALAAAAAGGWLASPGIVVLEEAAGVDIAPIGGLRLRESRRIGDTAITILTHAADRAG